MRLINLAGFTAIQKDVTTSGTPVKLSGYYANTTIAFNDNGASADTVTDSSSLLLKMGFRSGDKLVIAGSTSNDGTYEIASLVAGTITLVAAAELTTEVAGDSVVLDTLHGVPVSDGVGVLIKAADANTGTITVGSTSAKALNTNADYFSHNKLAAGQSINLEIKNLNSVWLDSTISGDGVEVVFES